MILIAGVEVSVRHSESHTLNASATRQTLESGARVTDHVILEPYSISISFEVTNTGDGPAIAKDVFETFKNMLEQRERLEVITEHHIYDNMVLTGLSPVHEAPFKGRLKCTANLVQVKQASLELAGRIPRILSRGRGGVIQKTASAPVNAGLQEGKEVDKRLKDLIAQKSPGKANKSPDEGLKEKLGTVRFRVISPCGDLLKYYFYRLTISGAQEPWGKSEKKDAGITRSTSGALGTKVSIRIYHEKTDEPNNPLTLAIDPQEKDPSVILSQDKKEVSIDIAEGEKEIWLIGFYCETHKKYFFDQAYDIISKGAQLLGLDEDFLLALAAVESGWLKTKKNKDANNLFGVTLAVGNKREPKIYSSLQESMGHWIELYAGWFDPEQKPGESPDTWKASKKPETMEEFIDILLATGSGKLAYNSETFKEGEPTYQERLQELYEQLNNCDKPNCLEILEEKQEQPVEG